MSDFRCASRSGSCSDSRVSHTESLEAILFFSRLAVRHGGGAMRNWTRLNLQLLALDRFPKSHNGLKTTRTGYVHWNACATTEEGRLAVGQARRSH